VRAPAEYERGHIPGAVNLPVFDDQERARVGTAYKQRSKAEAMEIGLDIVGPKMSGFVKSAKEIAVEGEVLIHCWRGGMRSASMGWLLETSGLKVTLLTGGYKAYRNHVREHLASGRRFVILGGFTGSGKTRWIRELSQSGEPVVDLEHLANHRGSVFGGIGLGDQPTNEQFENDLFAELGKYDKEVMIWLEDESRSIGSIFMPEPFYLAMKAAPLIRIRVTDDLRVRVILDEYAALGKEALGSAIRRISKRLGGLVTQQCMDFLEQDDYESVVRLLLPYYDKTYSHSLKTHPEEMIYDLDLTSAPEEDFVKILKEKKGSLNTKSPSLPLKNID
jgi:tRNA 2-selenouridine synthase